MGTFGHANVIHPQSKHEVFPNSCRQVAAQLVQYINKGTEADEVPVLVAHNGKNFDNRMLTAEFKRCGVSLPVTWQWLDTLPLARKLLPELTK